MQEILEIEYRDIKENTDFLEIIKKSLEICFKTEGLCRKSLYVNIILTTPEEIRKINKQYRNVDSATDVLSFPMFEKEELENYNSPVPEVLGDIVISIEKVEQQAEEYGHSFERELAYMVVHGFYHIVGYDHMEKEEKNIMRKKEEAVLEKIGLKR